MSERRPIETAPQDGTEIIAISNEDRWIVKWVAFPVGAYTTGGWQIKALPGRDPIVYIDPTHWAPLP